MPQQSKFERIETELKQEFRTFRLIPKDKSLLMKIIYRALGMRYWCPDFMTSYTTVIISVVYMPRELIGTDAGYRTLRHERVHMRDCWNTGVLPFAISYLFLFPAVFTLRSIWEMRGYAESMRVEYEETGTVSEHMLNHVEKQFTGSAYFWMCPFPKHVRKWVKKTRERVLSDG